MSATGLGRLKPRVFQQVVSLGPNCRPKANIQRVLGKRTSLRRVFDWQITPLQTLQAYLRDDFQGFFERDDLFAEPSGVVCNRKYATLHNHEFPPGVTDDVLRRQYFKARALHDGWCNETRRALDNSHSILFVFGKPLSIQDFRSLSGLIADRCPAKQFELLAGPEGDAPRAPETGREIRPSGQLIFARIGSICRFPPRSAI